MRKKVEIKTYSYLKLHGMILFLQLFILLWESSFETFSSTEVFWTQIFCTLLHPLTNFTFNYLEDNGKIIEWKIWKCDKYETL